eukprot:CAMPEP_0175135302 /NCGR_PEP_ID=MMETSP0087-20121206/8649_1 /TAXON_ID=136419 /ORGANISM="Unknown Unknown, Strain D1" /LENGTH=136 /DNA_ID=CAMNT_0016417941 /DNA_START=268 /DNA_END=679 /DNA_ORIENTATION=+
MPEIVDHKSELQSDLVPDSEVDVVLQVHDVAAGPEACVVVVQGESRAPDGKPVTFANKLLVDHAANLVQARVSHPQVARPALPDLQDYFQREGFSNRDVRPWGLRDGRGRPYGVVPSVVGDGQSLDGTSVVNLLQT